MTSNTKRIVFPLALLLIAAGLVSIIVASKKPPEKKPEKNEAPFVTVTKVELAPLTLTVKSQGLVKPKFDTRLLAQVSGEVTEVSPQFVRGGLVKKGGLLAQIDPFNYEVKLQQANASLAGAKAQFILERAQGRVAEAEWDKITNAEPSELGLRKPQQEQALAAVKAAEAGVRQATKDLQRTRIIAPFDALVTARSISPGTFVNMGANIGNVVNVETAEVRLPVPGNELAYLANSGIDSSVTLTAVVSGKPQQWQANIVRDEGVIDDSSRMVYLVAQITNPYQLGARASTASPSPARLPFGTYVIASIEGIQLEAAASVPRHLLSDNRLALIVDNKLAFAEVEIVRHEGKNSIISTGLESGDQLITSSLPYPIEGMLLKTELSSNYAEDSDDGAAVTTAEPVETNNTKKES